MLTIKSVCQSSTACKTVCKFAVSYTTADGGTAVKPASFRIDSYLPSTAAVLNWLRGKGVDATVRLSLPKLPSDGVLVLAFKPVYVGSALAELLDPTPADHAKKGKGKAADATPTTNPVA